MNPTAKSALLLLVVVTTGFAAYLSSQKPKELELYRTESRSITAEISRTKNSFEIVGVHFEAAQEAAPFDQGSVVVFQDYNKNGEPDDAEILFNGDFNGATRKVTVSGTPVVLPGPEPVLWVVKAHATDDETFETASELP